MGSVFPLGKAAGTGADCPRVSFAGAALLGEEATLPAVEAERRALGATATVAAATATATAATATAATATDSSNNRARARAAAGTPVMLQHAHMGGQVEQGHACNIT